MANPMARPIGRAAYSLGQGLRLGAFIGQAWLSDRLTQPVSPPESEPPSDAQRKASRARFRKELARLLKRDWKNIEAGHYRLPHDLVSAPISALTMSAPYFSDLTAVERRRQAGDARDLPECKPGEGHYPDYYLQNFHYQTDGYLSPHSAQLYDHQVEVLFGGAADLMRRQLLVPLKTALAERPLAEAQLLDLACGTGRFLTFVKDNYPTLKVTALDLSPAYIERAKVLLKPWRRVTFRCAAAEATGLGAESQDVITCVYLFHELPRAVRQAVAREMVRLLKPGGSLLFMDSLQLGDRPDLDPLLERFPVSFHEPYYADYIRQDLRALFTDAGLNVETVDTAYLSRLMVARKA